MTTPTTPTTDTSSQLAAAVGTPQHNGHAPASSPVAAPVVAPVPQEPLVFGYPDQDVPVVDAPPQDVPPQDAPAVIVPPQVEPSGWFMRRVAWVKDHPRESLTAAAGLVLFSYGKTRGGGSKK